MFKLCPFYHKVSKAKKHSQADNPAFLLTITREKEKKILYSVLIYSSTNPQELH